jgi:hypothetical protein
MKNVRRKMGCSKKRRGGREEEKRRVRRGQEKWDME